MFSPMFLLQTIWDKLVNGPIREPSFVIHLPKNRPVLFWATQALSRTTIWT